MWVFPLKPLFSHFSAKFWPWIPRTYSQWYLLLKIPVKTSSFGVSYIVVLKSWNALQERVYYSGVLTNWFFLHRATFWLETRNEKHDFCIFSIILMRKHVFQQNVKQLCLNFVTKTRHFTKKIVIIFHQNHSNIVWFHFLAWFQKNYHFSKFQ